MSQKAVRIIALVLAILMAGSVLIVAFTNVFALDETTGADTQTEAALIEDGEQPVLLSDDISPDTGTDGPPKVPIIIGAAAVVLMIACVAIPKIAKK